MNLHELIQLYLRAIDEDSPVAAKKTAHKVLAHKVRHEMDVMNQPIYIRDLVVKSPQYSRGESGNHTNIYQQPPMIRLKTQIKMLFDIANSDHRAHCCEQKSDGNFHLKQGYQNNITKLSTPEFAFYTQKSPLSSAEFAELYNTILADFKLDDNVQVLLSSFPVRDESGNMLNMCLFVEGGTPVQIHVFSKNSASGQDVMYGDLPFTQADALPPGFTKDSTPLPTGQVIYTGSVFEVRTLGGARYNQAVDVCFDHTKAHSKRQLLARIEQDACEYEILPEQIEHCVTSNTTFVSVDSILSDQILLADAHSTMCVSEKDGNYQMSTASSQHLVMGIEGLMVEPYSIFVINQGINYLILNPPFGSDLIVEAFAPRLAGRFKEEIRGLVRKHNSAALEKKLKFLQIDAPQSIQEAQILISDFSDKLLHHLKNLKVTLLQHCEPYMLELLFTPVELGQKTEARKIIEHAMDDIINRLVEEGGEAIEDVEAWRINLEQRLEELDILGGDSPFVQTLKAEIHHTLDIRLGEDLTYESPRRVSSP